MLPSEKQDYGRPQSVQASSLIRANFPIFDSYALRKLIPLKDGEIYNRDKYQPGVAVAAAYEEQGFMELTTNESLALDDDNQTVAVARCASRYTVNLGVPSVGYRSNKLASAPASDTRVRCPFRSSTDVGYIDKRIVAAAVGANGPASLRKTGCQGILLRGEVLFIEVDAKALNPLKTTSIHNAARMVESCATNPIRGGPARKPT
jgi:hypothetical protein